MDTNNIHTDNTNKLKYYMHLQIIQTLLYYKHIFFTHLYIYYILMHILAHKYYTYMHIDTAHIVDTTYR